MKTYAGDRTIDGILVTIDARPLDTSTTIRSTPAFSPPFPLLGVRPAFSAKWGRFPR